MTAHDILQEIVARKIAEKNVMMLLLVHEVFVLLTLL
jgi:hypothetical protein